MRWISALLASLLAPAVAVAGAAPSLPTADYAVTMRIDGLDAPILVRHHDGVLRQEMTLDGTTMIGLHDLRTGMVTMLQSAGDMKLAMELDAASAEGMMPAPIFGTGKGEGREIGTDVVAGHPCTIYRIVDGAQATDACVSAEGIMLRVSSQDAAGRTTMEATDVSIAPQDPALFVVPPDYQRMKLPPAGKFSGTPKPPGR